MTPKPVKLLLIEDSEDDAELVLRELKLAGMNVVHERVDTRAALQAALQKPWDLFVSDFSMPGFSGLEAFEIVKQQDPDAPFVFVSGVLSEERAVTAMRAGAKDFVLKGKLERLGPVLNRELAEAENRRDRAAIERALKIEGRRHQSIFNSTTVALFEIDFSRAKELLDSLPEESRVSSLVEGDEAVKQAADRVRVLAANPAAVVMMDAEGPEQLVGPLADVLRFGSRSVFPEILAALEGMKGLQREVQVESLQGRKIEVLLAFRAPPTVDDLQNVVLSMTDLTERNSIERQMRAAQRMEAVGRLAGGVAHDFNNILTVINSFSNFLLESDDIGDSSRADIQTIKDAATRAEGLTHQLLSFSRRRIAQVDVLDVNQLVGEMDKLLRRLIGEDIELETTLEGSLGLVVADPTHVEQVIMNLAVNARDAMPDGGKLTIKTGNITLDANSSPKESAEITPGEYVMIAVSDDGVGMDEETQLRIFEPFFTTKEVGKGTGLGLSTVYGIVKQSGGFVWVHSEPGKGTTFQVHLPRTDKAKEAFVPRPPSPEVGGTETILLVEDEEQVRRAAERILKKAGYEVLTAPRGGEGLLLCEGHAGPIHAMITDIVMPTMNGRELAELVSALRPGIRVLHMSGYPSNTIDHRAVLERGVVFLQKPFTQEQLLSKLRAVLDAE